MTEARGFRRLSEASVQARTGRGWAAWLVALDAHGMREKGHTETARWLQEEHGVSPWWAQAVVIRYEWERGLRA